MKSHCFCPTCWVTWLTFATWSGFWCSTPPWRRKPHGAPPDNVIITSSATIVLLCLSFWTFLLFLGYFPLFCLFLFHLGGPQCIGPMVSNRGPPQRVLTCSLPATLSGLWLLSESSSEADAHTWTHTQAHFCTPTHAHSGPTIIAKGESEGEGERERNMMGGGSVSAYTEECLAQMSEGRVQHNTCPVTQTYVTGLLIAPPKIGHHHHHHLHCFACSSADQGKVNIQNVQMALFHIWLYSIEIISNL